MRELDEIYESLRTQAPELDKLDLSGMLSMTMGFMQAATEQNDSAKRKNLLANMAAVAYRAWKMEEKNGK